MIFDNKNKNANNSAIETVSVPASEIKKGAFERIGYFFKGLYAALSAPAGRFDFTEDPFNFEGDQAKDLILRTSLDVENSNRLVFDEVDDEMSPQIALLHDASKDRVQAHEQLFSDKKKSGIFTMLYHAIARRAPVCQDKNISNECKVFWLVKKS